MFVTISPEDEGSKSISCGRASNIALANALSTKQFLSSHESEEQERNSKNYIILRFILNSKN